MAEKCLVTGGAGFIGSNLCLYLLKKGYSVVCLDDYSTGFENNLNDCKKFNNFQLIKWDVTEPYDYDVDYIFNLACPASPPKYQKDPIKTLNTSYLGVKNALELARKTNATILQASTSEVYGDPLVHPQIESYWGNVNPVGIRSCYDEGKRVAETLMVEYRRKYDVKTKIVRIFNTYGPKMDPEDGRVVSNVIVNALKNTPITVYGNGLQTRSFCYVDDLVNGLYSMIKSPSEVCGPINLGNPGEFTIMQLVNLVKKKVETNSEVVYLPLPGDDPTKRKPDITKARELLKWEPHIELTDGLDKTIEYFRSKVQ